MLRMEVKLSFALTMSSWTHLAKEGSLMKLPCRAVVTKRKMMTMRMITMRKWKSFKCVVNL